MKHKKKQEHLTGGWQPSTYEGGDTPHLIGEGVEVVNQVTNKGGSDRVFTTSLNSGERSPSLDHFTHTTQKVSTETSKNR